MSEGGRMTLWNEAVLFVLARYLVGWLRIVFIFLLSFFFS